MAASDSLIKRASEELEDFISAVVPDEIAALIGKRRVIDLNKESGKYRLRLFGICSSNVDSRVMRDVKEILQVKYATIVGMIIEDLIAEARSKGKNEIKAMSKGLSNSRYNFEKTAASVLDKSLVAENCFFDSIPLHMKPLNEAPSRSYNTSFNSGFGEPYGLEARTRIKNPNGDLHKNAAATRLNAYKTNTYRAHYENLMRKKSNSALNGLSQKDLAAFIDSDYNIDSLPDSHKQIITDKHKKSIKDAWQAASDEIDYYQNTNSEYLGSLASAEANKYTEVQVRQSFNTTVNIMPIEASKILEVVGHTRDRSILYNYIKLRAGTNSFWKDFVLNLDEIDRAVQRNVSNSLDDRILTSMMRKGGTLTPTLFSDIAEAKYYILVLDKSDVDTLIDKYKLDIRKNSALHLLFDKYNLLSLCIVDQIKKDVYIYSSDDPTSYDTVNYAVDNDTDKLMQMFTSLARN